MKLYGFEQYIELKPDHLGNKKKWAWKPKKLSLINNTKKLLAYHKKIEIYARSKQPSVLILARKTTAIGALLLQLKKQNKPFIYLNWDEFIHEGSLIYDHEKKINLIQYKKYVIDLNKIKSIFYDYSELEEVFYFKRSLFTSKEKVFLARWMECLKILEYVCNEANWCPAPPSIMRFEVQNKYGESLQARKLGPYIPKMIFTNDSFYVQTFINRNKTILKDSGLSMIEQKNRKILNFQSQIIQSSSSLNSIKTAPCLFQQFIDKQYDIRAVVVGDNVFSVKIDSQRNTSTREDWRTKEHLVPFYSYKLPQSIQKKLVALTKSKGLNFASCDLVKGKDSKYYFLEINRPGHWFYLEVLSGIPLSKALAKLLK